MWWNPESCLKCMTMAIVGDFRVRGCESLAACGLARNWTVGFARVRGGLKRVSLPKPGGRPETSTMSSGWSPPVGHSSVEGVAA